MSLEGIQSATRSTTASRRVIFVRALVSEPWHSGGAKICQALPVWRSDLGNRDGTATARLNLDSALPFVHSNG